MQAALDLTLEYTHDREQFGKKIGTFQLIQGKLAGKLSSIPRIADQIFPFLDCSQGHG